MRKSGDLLIAFQKKKRKKERKKKENKIEKVKMQESWVFLNLSKTFIGFTSDLHTRDKSAAAIF